MLITKHYVLYRTPEKECRLPVSEAINNLGGLVGKIPSEIRPKKIYSMGVSESGTAYIEYKMVMCGKKERVCGC